jgi:hypothetical protein
VAAAAAALVLAVLSRGDGLVLAVLLAAGAWRPLALGATVPALVAATWRWGSSSLEALAGAQAVLGPAGWVGPPRSAAASWLAALALVLAAPAALQRVGGRTARWARAGAPNLGRSGALLLAAATGTAAAAVVAGPAPGGDVWVRVVAGALATGLAALVGALRRRSPRWSLALDAAAIAAGVAALVLVSGAAPTWSGTLDGSVAANGAAVALAVAMAASVGARTVAAMGQRRP